MCDKCHEYDEKIERYRRLAGQVMDDLFATRVGTLITELIAEKAKLHPANEEGDV